MEFSPVIIRLDSGDLRRRTEGDFLILASKRSWLAGSGGDLRFLA